MSEEGDHFESKGSGMPTLLAGTLEDELITSEEILSF